MRLATFNVQNMRLRDGCLDGARDRDLPEDLGPSAAVLDWRDRVLTAEVIRETRADVIALQEVFDQATLDEFHDNHLLPAGCAAYPYRFCLPGNDGRGLDVAVLSQVAPVSVSSHAQCSPRSLGIEAPPGFRQDAPIFRRDCLEVKLPQLSLFICHFKAPYPDPETTRPIRKLEASAVRRLIEQRFDRSQNHFWMVLGDLNTAKTENPEALNPLAEPFSVDLTRRLPASERWSFHDSHDRFYAQPDAMRASPALAKAFPDATPRFLRIGMARETREYEGPRLHEVGHHRPHASDHAALVVDLPGL